MGSNLCFMGEMILIILLQEDGDYEDYKIVGF